MNKTAAITALAVSALALASCSSEAPNDDNAANDASTQTTAQESTDDTSQESAAETPQETTEEAPAETTAASSASNSGRFDEAALKTELEALGYQCDGDDDCTKTDGAIIYDIDIDDDSVDAEVQGNGELDQHFETILSDVGTAFGDYDFGGASWDEIETWAMSASEDQETRIGTIDLEHDLGDDDGVPTRQLGIELTNS